MFTYIYISLSLLNGISLVLAGKRVNSSKGSGFFLYFQKLENTCQTIFSESSSLFYQVLLVLPSSSLFFQVLLVLPSSTLFFQVLLVLPSSCYSSKFILILSSSSCSLNNPFQPSVKLEAQTCPSICSTFLTKLLNVTHLQGSILRPKKHFELPCPEIGPESKNSPKWVFIMNG